MTVKSVTQAVSSNPCTSIAATVGTLMALGIWAASQFGVTVPGWAAALIATAALSFALALPGRGLVGFVRFVLFGRFGKN